MKRIAVTLLMVAAMASIPPRAKPQSSPPQAHDPNCALAYICGVIIVAGVGSYVIYQTVKFCRNMSSNMNWQATNVVVPELVMEGAFAPVKLQSTTSLGSVWKDEVEVRMTQMGNVVTGVAYTNGIPAMTNSCQIDTNGWAKLDFSSLPSTNRQPSRLFRLVQ